MGCQSEWFGSVIEDLEKRKKAIYSHRDRDSYANLEKKKKMSYEIN